MAAVIGSAPWLASVTVGIYWLEHHRPGTVAFYYPAIFFTNAALAAAGSAAGVAFTPLPPWRRVVFAAAAAPLAFLVYVAFVIVGSLVCVDLTA